MVFTNVGSAFSRKTICLTFMGLVCIVEMPDYREYTKEVQDRSKESKERNLSSLIFSWDLEYKSLVFELGGMFPMGGWTGGI